MNHLYIALINRKLINTERKSLLVICRLLAVLSNYNFLSPNSFPLSFDLKCHRLDRAVVPLEINRTYHRRSGTVDRNFEIESPCAPAEEAARRAGLE